ncbi:MAG: DNA topoisomerase IB [Nocardioides sp.]|uniref:DNA topoisomerase IB n=1 Tax=Nocardioides sp. TaxID=35761 RepID=UPI003EFF2605
MRRSSPEEPGWTRRRAGRGFTYVDARGRRAGADTRARLESLAVPPAWREVWICADPDAHLQAVGTDDAGRRQYLFHPDWVAARAREKYDRVLELGRRLGRARVRVGRDLQLERVPLERACATAFRMLDLGALRIGNDVYADEDGGFGLTTLERRHARRRGEVLHLDFVGKSGVEHHVEISDVEVLAAVEAMRRRRGSPDLLSYRGDRWRSLGPTHVNDYVRSATSVEVTAKDFRTWHGTVVAARALTEAARAQSWDEEGPPRGWESVAWEAAAELLGNSPAQARESYVDPRVVEAHAGGRRLRPWRDRRDLERAVLQLVEAT